MMVVFMSYHNNLILLTNKGFDLMHSKSNALACTKCVLNTLNHIERVSPSSTNPLLVLAPNRIRPAPSRPSVDRDCKTRIHLQKCGQGEARMERVACENSKTCVIGRRHSSSTSILYSFGTFFHFISLPLYNTKVVVPYDL